MYKILLLILILAGNTMRAQESNVKINHQGKEFTMLRHAWKAQWITHPTESTLDYGVFLFRRSFDLKRKPNRFVIHISADNRYRLYVNGKYVVAGPSVGDISHQRYESLDIAANLKRGRNALAVEVVNFGEYRRAAQQTFQTALIVQGDPENPVDINTGHTDWKVIRNQAYSVIPFTSDSLKTYYAAGPGDRLDAAQYPWGWQDTAFDDRQWLRARKATVEFAVGRGFLYGSTWFLVPRTIPFMEEKYEPFGRIVRTEGIAQNDRFLRQGDSWVIPGNSSVSILIDQTYHTSGFPELTFSKGKNSRIKITYAEALFKDMDPDQPIGDGNLLNVDLKGNRNNSDGKSIFGYYDIVWPDGGEQRLYKPLSRRTYRFIQLDVETGDEELILNKYHGVFTAYPFREKAKFHSDDPFLSRIWATAWRTLRNSAEESFFDPYYEQLQYIGDTRIEALVSIYVSGDDRLMRKAIRQFDDSRIPEGLTQSRFPSYIVQIIPTYSLLWIDMMHDYFMYRDDPEFLRQFIPGIQSVLGWFERKVDDNGLLANLDWWNFTDWTRDFPNGIPPGADDGHSANVSLQFVKSLENAAELFSYFGLAYESSRYQALALRIKKAVMAHCFVPEKGLLADTPDKKRFSQHTNIFGILTDTFAGEDQPSVMRKVLDDASLTQATIYFKFYLFRALQKTGMGNRYTELLQPWKTMIDNGMTTFGETDINPRSECHAWSASPCFDFLHTIAGIHPAEPSFRSVIIAPNLGSLTEVAAEMPHPRGKIKVSIWKSGARLRAEVFLPGNLKGTFIWQGRKVELSGGEQKFEL